jgi:hypothetical protein
MLISGIVPEAAQIVDEPGGVDIEESTSQGSASKRKKVSHIRKIKLLPLYRDDEFQSVGSSSESEEATMHSPSSSSCSYE